MSFIFGLIIWVLRLIAIAILVYCILSFVAPTGKAFNVMKPYVEPILKPFRDMLAKRFPKVLELSFDITPVVVIVVIEIIVWVLDLIF